MWSLDYTQVKTTEQTSPKKPKERLLSATTPLRDRVDSSETTTTSKHMIESMHKSSMFSSMQSEGLASPSFDSPEIQPISSPQTATLTDESAKKPVFFTSGTNFSESDENSDPQLKGDHSNVPPPESDDFVFIETSKCENPNVLKPGYKWKRELIFKSKLTMHTSYDRKDNSDPASVTALSISRDHKTIYVGDSRGRVFTWVISYL